MDTAALGGLVAAVVYYRRRKVPAASLEQPRSSPIVFLIVITPLVIALVVNMFFYGNGSGANSWELRVEDHSARLAELETSLIQTIYSNVTNEWVDVFTHGSSSSSDSSTLEKWQTHYLFGSSSNSDRVKVGGSSGKPKLLLVHGYGTSSAIAWRNMMSSLVDKYDVYAVDLPGFGRSEPPPRLLHVDTSGKEAMNMYCAFFDALIDTLGLSSSSSPAPYVVAHSFGGFLYTHCAAKNPLLAKSMLLADVPGFFSTNGGNDFVWASFFRFGMPQAAIRPWGLVGRELVGSIIRGFSFDVNYDLFQYWYALHLTPSLRSHIVVSKFVLHSYVYAIGSELALVPLLSLPASMKVTLLHGDKDTISPAHQGKLINEITGIEHIVLEGSGHVPYLASRAKRFTELIFETFAEEEYVEVSNGSSISTSSSSSLSISSSSSSSSSSSISAIGESPELLSFLASCLDEKAHVWTQFKCVPSSFFTNRSMRKMYSALRVLLDECKRAFEQQDDAP